MRSEFFFRFSFFLQIFLLRSGRFSLLQPRLTSSRPFSHARNPPAPQPLPNNSLASKVYKGKKIDKGIAFPTCLSVNSVVGHYCPAADDATVLNEGDCVKIDLGAHIDGWIAVGAHTVILSPEPIKGRDADLLAATSACMEAALRTIRPGKKAKELAPVLQKIAASYGCTVVEGVLCHQMKQAVIDGHKTAPNRVSPVEGASPAQQAQAAAAAAKEGENEFEEGEAWAVDVVLSTGVGSARVLDEKATTVSFRKRGKKREREREREREGEREEGGTTKTERKQQTLTLSSFLFLHPKPKPKPQIYKRALDVEYSLKMKASRTVFSEISKRFSTMPFALRALATPGARLGVIECVNHYLLQAYPVLHERSSERVAQLKTTVLLMPNGSDRVTGVPLQPHESDKSVEDELVKKLLATSLKPKKKKPAAAAKAAAAPAPADAKA